MLRRVMMAGGGTVTTTMRLFHLNGANNSTTFTDSASSATVTVNGGAKLTTTSPKFGTASALLGGSGSGDWWKSANDAGLDFGTGDYCVEGWLNFVGTGNQGIFHMYPGTPANDGTGLALAYNGSQLQMNEGGGNTFGAWSPSTGTWYHWAWFRIGTTTYVAIDGVIKITKGATGGPISGNDLNLGMYFSTSFTFNGKLDEIRVSKGTAVYSSSGFTPPSAEFTYP